MSKLSLYQTGWINLIFQDRNKEYGAYQLRQESAKTSLTALFMGLLFSAAVVAVPMIISYYNPQNSPAIAIPEFTNTTVQLTDIVPNQLVAIPKQAPPEIKKQTTAIPILNDQLVHPVIVQAPLASPDILKTTDYTSAPITPTKGMATATTSTSFSLNTGTGAISTSATGNTIINSVALDNLPEFPGGINKFYHYVGANFEKQEIGGSGSIQVSVSFVIERDGSMTDIQVKRDPGYGLGKEAVRVLKSLKTKWTPGMINGKAVRTAYTLPITVQMN